MPKSSAGILMKFSSVDSFLGSVKFAKPKSPLFGVAEAAQAFVAALWMGKLAGRVWIVCRDLKSQEEFASELSAWCSRVRLFPDLEIPSEEALPDAETESERLDLLRARGGQPLSRGVRQHALRGGARLRPGRPARLASGRAREEPLLDRGIYCLAACLHPDAAPGQYCLDKIGRAHV